MSWLTRQLAERRRERLFRVVHKRITSDVVNGISDALREEGVDEFDLIIKPLRDDAVRYQDRVNRDQWYMTNLLATVGLLGLLIPPMMYASFIALTDSMELRKKGFRKAVFPYALSVATICVNFCQWGMAVRTGFIEEWMKTVTLW